MRYFTLPVHLAEVSQNPRAVDGGVLAGFPGTLGLITGRSPSSSGTLEGQRELSIHQSALH